MRSRSRRRPTRWRSRGSSSRRCGGWCWPTRRRCARRRGARRRTASRPSCWAALAVGFLDEVWTPDDRTQTRRRLITRRCALVRARTRAKNQVHAGLARNLLGRPPVCDLFGGKGRAWLAEQIVGLPLDERLSGDAALRQVDFLAGELEQLDRILGADALSDRDALRLMTIPGGRDRRHRA